MLACDWSVDDGSVGWALLRAKASDVNAWNLECVRNSNRPSFTVQIFHA